MRLPLTAQSVYPTFPVLSSAFFKFLMQFFIFSAKGCAKERYFQKSRYTSSSSSSWTGCGNSTVASATANTLCAPASSRACAQAEAVAPVVRTSSTRRMRFPSSLRPGHPEGTRHIGHALFQRQTGLMPFGAGAGQCLRCHRHAHRPGKGLCHPLRHIVAALFAGGRYRTIRSYPMARPGTGCGRGSPLHGQFTAKGQLGQTVAHLHSPPRLALILCVQDAAPHTAANCNGRARLPHPAAPGSAAPGSRMPGLRRSVSSPRRSPGNQYIPQHPVTKRAAARVEQLPHRPQRPAQGAVIVHQSFLTAMMTRTFFPAAQPKLSYQPVSW